MMSKICQNNENFSAESILPEKALNYILFCLQILVVWLAPSRIPDRNQWPKTKASLRVIHPGRKVRLLAQHWLSYLLIACKQVTHDDIIMTRTCT